MGVGPARAGWDVGALPRGRSVGLAVERHRAVPPLRGFVERRDDALRVFDLIRARTEDLIDGRDLARMDERLARETEPPSGARVALKTGGVLDVRPDPVDRHLTGGDGRYDDRAAR